MFKKRLVQFLKIAVPISLGIYLVVHIYGQLDESQRHELFHAFASANYFWVFLSLLMGAASHFLRGYRWNFQLEAMGYRPDTTNNFMAVMVGYIVNLALPRMGEVSRAAAITKYNGVPFQKSFGSILSERALDLIVLMIITGTTIILQYQNLREFGLGLLEKAKGAAGSTSVQILAGVLIVLLLVGIYALRTFRHMPVIGKIHALVLGLAEGLRSILRMKKRGLYILSTVGIWVLYVGMFWICFLALDGTAHLGADAVFTGFVLGSFAIVLIPGGIGAFPVGVMQSLLLYGVSRETGFALGWIIWTSQTILVLSLGGLSMMLMPIYNKKKGHVETATH